MKRVTLEFQKIQSINLLQVIEFYFIPAIYFLFYNLPL